MSKTIEYICNTCDGAGPWSEDARGSDGFSIVKFHRKLGHVVVEYQEPEKIKHDYGKWNDEDRENFKKSLREESQNQNWNMSSKEVNTS
jgi:hypothetical protein